MSYGKQDLNGTLNNRNLALRNEASSTLADSKTVFYLDISQVYADAYGNLASLYTRDGLHVKPDHYALWVDYAAAPCHSSVTEIKRKQELHMKYKAVIFDLDGTLLNTLEDLMDAVNYALTKYGYPARTLSEIRAFVGNGVRKLMERALPDGADIHSLNCS